MHPSRSLGCRVGHHGCSLTGHHAARGTARPCHPHGCTQHVVLVASATIHKSPSGSESTAPSGFTTVRDMSRFPSHRKAQQQSALMELHLRARRCPPLTRHLDWTPYALLW